MSLHLLYVVLSLHLRVWLEILSPVRGIKSKGWHTQGDQTLILVRATNPLKNFHEGTGGKDLSHEQFTQSILKNKSQGLVPKIQTGLNSWDQSRGPKLVSVTSF